MEGSSDGKWQALGNDARKRVWMGAIPLLVTLHSSEVTTLPGPSPSLVLAPRNGYLVLLTDAIKLHFQSSLLPGSETIWFDYEGLPLKWHIPTGVLFDLLCAEPERPWKLTVHFRAYPSEVLIPCENEETVKWSFINAMKEASYVMYGSTKSVMNMSQVDQFELWKSVVKGDLESFDHIFRRLRPGSSSNYGRSSLTHGTSGEPETDVGAGSRLGGQVVHPGRIPMRLYIRLLSEEMEDLFDVPPANSWDELIYLTRPMDVVREEGFFLTLGDALRKVVPYLFSSLGSGIAIETTDPSYSHSHEVNVCELEARRTYSDVAKGKLEMEVEHDLAASSSLDEPDDTSAQPHEGRSEYNPMGQDILSQKPHKTFRRKSSQLNLSAGGPEKSTFGKGTQFNGFVRIQGIQPNLDIPLYWVARNLCGPEQFVHVCICTWVPPP